MDSARVSILDPDAPEKLSQQYKALIDRVANDREDKVIGNSSPDHAAYIIRKLLETASKAVRICTGSLSQTFGGVPIYRDKGIIDAAMLFLTKPATRMSIIVADSIDGGEEHPLLKRVSGSAGADRCKVLQLQADAKDKAKLVPFHFSVADDIAYRLEPDPQRVEAIVNFGDRSIAAALASFFDDLAEGPLATRVA